MEDAAFNYKIVFGDTYVDGNPVEFVKLEENDNQKVDAENFIMEKYDSLVLNGKGKEVEKL